MREYTDIQDFVVVADVDAMPLRCFFSRVAVRILFGLCLSALIGLALSGPALTAEGASHAWRLRVKGAAVVAGDTVTLGEIAEPVGEIAGDVWAKLALTPLWASPPAGKPMNMTRPSIQRAMAAYLRELSGLCIYPASLTIQQGGVVYTDMDLRSLVVKTLTPLLGSLPGEGSLQDFRLPGHVFVTHAGQKVELEDVPKLTAGRIPLRFAVLELDGVVLRRLTGSVFLDLWADVPCAGAPVNRDEVLRPEKVSFSRKNLAHMKDTPWDGRGGPWRVTRAIGTGQPILQSDVAVVHSVKKGAHITLAYEGKTVSASMMGEALHDASAGENILVRNLHSKKQLRGVVRDSQTVMVN